MERNAIRFAVCCALMGGLAGCGGGSSDSSSTTTPAPAAQTATVPVIVSDASSDDWALIGVKVESIALIPQGGGSNVTVYSAPASDPAINLEQLDQLGEILGNAAVPVGTYTGAIVTIGGNSGDVMLTAAADPQAGFALPGGTVVSSSNIQIQNTQGAGSNLSVPITVNFVSPLVVNTSQTNALDLEFDLSHPAFVIGHNPPGASATQWAVNFDGPVRHRSIADIRQLVLRHAYGSVTAIASDNSSMTITKEFPTYPIVNPETAVAGSGSLTILADATNGTLFYDVDAKTTTTIMNFSAESSLTGKYVRVAARYQEDGTLVATRIWASSSFASVWLSPEGHVLDVDANTNTIVVTNESGVPVPVQIASGTEFFFRQPANPQADAKPIGTGTSFLSNENLVRGFKVHVSAVDPLATPLVAQSVDIETAAFSGAISQATASAFTYTHDYLRISDDYKVALNYIDPATANGNDPKSGTPITGYKWWNFAYPTIIDSGTSAIGDFVAASGGSVSFGGSAAAIPVWGVSYAIWGDPANSTGWSAAASILEPVPVPLATVTTALAASGSDYAFTISATGGTQPVTVDVSNGSGSATLVYQVDRSNGTVSVSPIDITTASGLSTLTNALTAGTPVALSGVPQPDGTIKAYVITYFTGTMPAG